MKNIIVIAILGSMVAFAATLNTDRAMAEETKTAIFGGGCFWCMEPPYDELQGVIDTTVGYAGGETENPTYKEVSSGNTGHAEVIRVTYDPDQVSYERLLQVFFQNVDPFDAGGQFCDRGTQYRSAIFPVTEEQRSVAREMKKDLEAHFGRSLATTIEEPGIFYPAEEYHQNYYKTHSLRYKFYRFTCGRDDRLEDVWGEEPSRIFQQGKVSP